jgi:hypothetical protein
MMALAYCSTSYLFYGLNNRNWREKKLYERLSLLWPDVEYSDPGGLQEKLERLNHIMSGDWDHASRRAPYLNQCKLK